MSDGFIKLWRKSIGSRVFKNDGLWKIWTWCLMRASHKKRWVSFKVGRSETEVEILPGQFIFGRRSAAKKLRMNPNTIWKRMQKLKNMQNITLESNRKYTIVSIVNWDAYQIKENKSNLESVQQVSSRCPAGVQQVTQTRRVKNEENVKEKKKIPKKNSSFKSYLKQKIIENNLIESKDKIFEFYNYRMSMIVSKRYKTEKGIDGLITDLNGCREAGMIIAECIEKALQKEWLTPDPSYFKTSKKNNQNQNTQICQEWANGK